MDDDQQALLMNALEELASLRSDIVSELGSSTSDLFLKCSFADAVDRAARSVRLAML